MNKQPRLRSAWILALFGQSLCYLHGPIRRLILVCLACKPFCWFEFSRICSDLYEIIIGMIKIMTLNNALCEYRIILNVLIVCLFKKSRFQKTFQECDQSTKQIGSWSGPWFCRTWSGSKMFAKQNTSWTELNVTISINAINYHLLRGS